MQICYRETYREKNHKILWMAKKRFKLKNRNVIFKDQKNQYYKDIKSF